MSDQDLNIPETQRLPFRAQATPATSSLERKTEIHVMPTKVPTNFDDLSVEELKLHQEEIQRKLLEKEQAEKKGVIKQITDVVHTYGITIEELIEALGGHKPKRKGVKAEIKFRDPETGDTWSGRGKEPTWMKGRKREQFLIKDE